MKIITKDKNKLKPKTKSKILVLGLMLSAILLVGFFGPTPEAQAQATGTCTIGSQVVPNITYTECQRLPGSSSDSWIATTPDSNALGTCSIAGGISGASTLLQNQTLTSCTSVNGSFQVYSDNNPSPDAVAAAANSDKNALWDETESCAKLFVGMPSGVYGCIEVITYFLFITIPSFLMGLAANFFNFLASLTLSSEMYKLPFIDSIWKIVRDFANIFFILILLYAAFQIILGLHESGAKKIIGMVIVVALLVNFSLFFTKIVIDSSNIVALIFYNRIDTTNVDSYKKIGNASAVEKDMAGALVSRFNINTFFTPEFFATLDRENRLFGLYTVISPALLVSMMVTYGLVVYALTYAFFMTAMSFLGRMIMLMMLMIISPLAFVTAAVPKFKGINTIGFDSWLKKLLEASFVAAIFMFILYIISEILKAKIFEKVADKTNEGMIASLLMLFIPAILIVVLLLKGTSYAKKASGEFTEGVIKGVKVIGGLAGGVALGAAAGGAAAVGRATVGRTGSALANSEWAKTHGAIGRGLQNVGKFTATRSFDVRKAPGAEGLANKTGINLGAAKTIGLGPKEGGFEKAKQDKITKRRKRAEELEVGENEGLKQDLNALEREKQELMREGSHAIELVDGQIKGQKEAVEAANATLRAETAPSGTPGTAGYTPGSAGYAAAQARSRTVTAQLNELRAMRSSIKNADGTPASIATRTAAVTAARAAAAAAVGTPDEVYRSVAAEAAEAALAVATHSAAGTGRSINQLEDIHIPQAQHAIQSVNRDRKWAYADQITRFGRFWEPLGSDANREAAHKVRMEAKIDDKGGH